MKSANYSVALVFLAACIAASFSGCHGFVSPSKIVRNKSSQKIPVAFFSSTSDAATKTKGPIRNWLAKRKAKKEIKKIRSLFADDAVICVATEDNVISLADYVAAEEALFASFPDLSFDYDEDCLADDFGDGVFILDGVLTGTFTGEDYVYGDDADAIVATGEAVAKETVYTMTVLDGLITKMLIAGGTPQFFYDQVAAIVD
mmetsp:Transcript_17890/g.38824  ORF Transcript_17890/g.38824 Transcript_17890/m.38824 type:complete len:202 (-) Transcript_17890:128-733(-)|eukprot:CAMPEP_0178555136 /NCGR_PEP_ID=MMETSP0697-20121206/8700_1 /TAXON_ID=265572 /ORGANISM="Extubocellulus spinifer, Strain CCMP396" /LENGTH=201 /DNA_ID=CAMNT_0020188121 /DNA_START=37 /DNA_END=642 /DNA_ORIENTATION=-